MVDKNLFLYDLALVAIMKNEAPYVKEWIDYHLLAGVDHFYIYDNDSPDNLKEILQPYIDAEIVTYIFYPGKCRQMESYNDAIKNFRFECRYLAFIDGDEFIFPKSKSTIVPIIDEILTQNLNAGGLAVNWRMFGSNNLETADYDVGVLDRFTKRATELFTAAKTISDARKIKYSDNPHFVNYFDGYQLINEKSNIVSAGLCATLAKNNDSTDNKIVINHYREKSFEEYKVKVARGNADYPNNRYTTESFSHKKFNDEYDDSILKYRDTRQVALLPQGGGVWKLCFILRALIICVCLMHLHKI